MAWRFRKSVKIAPGIRMSFSKSGVSTTVGGRGASLSFGKRGVYQNVSIPGTGLSSRTKLAGPSSRRGRNSSSSSRQGVVKSVAGDSAIAGITASLDSQGNIQFHDQQGNIIADKETIAKVKRSSQFKQLKKTLKEGQERLAKSTMEAEDATLDRILNLVKDAPVVRDKEAFLDDMRALKPEIYTPQAYLVPPPTSEQVQEEVSREADKAVTGFFLTLGWSRRKYFKQHFEERFYKRIHEWEEDKKAFDANQARRAKEENAKNQTKVQKRQELLGEALEGDPDAVECLAEEWMSESNLPFAASAQYEYRSEQNALMVDLDLPEIEDLPQEETVQLKNGSIKRKKKSQGKIREEYAQCVFGFVVYAAAALFDLSPAVQTVCISAYTQRRDKDGNEFDAYILSVAFPRGSFLGLDYDGLDAEEFCMGFENRCRLSTTKRFGVIKPFE